MQRSVSSGRRDRGQALPEFALVAPVFFLLLFAVIQLGLVFGEQNGVVNAVRDTARRAATYRVGEASLVVQQGAAAGTGICGSIANELTAQLAAAVPGYDARRVVRTIGWTWRSNPDGTTYFLYVTVDVKYKHALYVPLVAAILDRFDSEPTGNNLILDASEEMRVENPALDPSTRANLTCP